MRCNQSNVSFGTNIILVSPKELHREWSKAWNADNLDTIDYWETDSENKEKLGYRTTNNSVYTYEVRTCTAGVVTKKDSKPPFVFHFFHSKKTLDGLCKVKQLIDGENAILIGSKKNVECAKEVFDEIQQYLKKKNIPTTILKTLCNSWEAKFIYDSKKDNLYLCVKDYFNEKKYVKSIDDLKKVFETVMISSKDKVYFKGQIKYFIDKLLRRI